MGQNASMDFDSYASYTLKDLSELPIVGKPPPEVYLVGVAIAQKKSGLNRPSMPEVLFVRRKDETDYYPGIWHLPGGKIEASDKDVEAAIKRLIFNKINLKVMKIVHMLPHRYVGKDAEEETKVPNPEGGDDLVVKKRYFMINFVVEVENLDAFFIKDPEYTDKYWIDPDMLPTVGCQTVLKRTASQALIYFDQYRMPERQQHMQDVHQAKQDELKEQAEELRRQLEKLQLKQEAIQRQLED